MEQKSIISEQTRKELDKNTVDFYLSEAEKQLDGVVDVSNRITERAYILLTGIITVWIWMDIEYAGRKYKSCFNFYHWYIGFYCGSRYFDIENYMYSYSLATR